MTDWVGEMMTESERNEAVRVLRMADGEVNADLPVDDTNDLTAVQYRNRFDYEVPQVSWQQVTEKGIVVAELASPLLPVTASHLEVLRYHAALIEHRTGLRLRVAPAEPPTAPADTNTLAVPIDDPQDQYEVAVAHATGGPASFELTYAWMSGFLTGVFEVQWKASE
jgi:hypothetical protein